MAAEAETGGEKTEEPSQRRLQEARERGQIPRSRELTVFATMIGGSATLVAIGGSLSEHLSQLMRGGLSIDVKALNDTHSMITALTSAALMTTKALLPIFGALVSLVLLASVLLGGWNFSPTAMAPDFSRLSPLSGLKRVFGMHGASELGKALLKLLMVGGVCAGIVSWLFGDVLALGHMLPREAIGRGVGLLGWAFVWLSASLALVAMIDVPLQIFQFKRQLRMTRQELRDESKELDGRPETKQRIRQMQQMLARRRMLHKVPAADVVLVNPTHFAVASEIRPEKNARTARARQRRRPGRGQYPQNRRRAPRTDFRIAQADARVVPLDGSRQGDSDRFVHGSGASAVVHLPHQDLESDIGCAPGASEPAG